MGERPLRATVPPQVSAAEKQDVITSVSMPNLLRDMSVGSISFEQEDTTLAMAPDWDAVLEFLRRRVTLAGTGDDLTLEVEVFNRFGNQVLRALPFLKKYVVLESKRGRGLSTS